MEFRVKLRSTKKHKSQQLLVESEKKRKIIKAGRRGGKTTGAALVAVKGFLAGKRVLYAAPTTEQIDRFWHEVVKALAEPIEFGIYRKNETRHIIELAGTEQRIRAKTAWNADTLRGDYADLLILDEWQLMNESAWEDVGAPMLIDNAGDAIFIFTPPSFRSRSITKANDPQHAVKMFRKAKTDPRWLTLHFSSHENPYLSRIGLEEVTRDMSSLSYRLEVLAEDIEDIPGALWRISIIEKYRITPQQMPELVRLAVGVDPEAMSTGDSAETGIIVLGMGTDKHGYVIADNSLRGTPAVWGAAVVKAYQDNQADKIIGEINNGGEMVEHTIRTITNEQGVNIGRFVNVKVVRATRGKAIRAEPVSALYENGRVHHVGVFPHLEDQLCNWIPGDKKSPDRLDALVWVASELLLNIGVGTVSEVDSDEETIIVKGVKRLVDPEIDDAFKAERRRSW